MINQIRNIFKSGRIHSNIHDSKHFCELMQIKNDFFVDFNDVESDEHLIKLVIHKIKDIIKKYSLKIDFYLLIDEKNNKWTSLINYQKWVITENDFKGHNADKTVTTGSYKKLSQQNGKYYTSDMIQIKYVNNNQYLFEVFQPEKYKSHYILFFATLEFMFGSYLKFKETKVYKLEKNLCEKKLNESEQKVSSAQKAMKRRVYELHNLVEASNEIYSILDFKQLINSALLTIIGQIGFQQALMLMYNKEKQSFSNIFQKGFGEYNFDGFEFDMNSPIVSYFLKHRTPAYLSRIEQDEGLEHLANILKSLGVFIVAPLIYSERLQGIVCASEKLHSRNFTESDFEMLHILVNIISIAIGNSNLFQEMKNLSLTDGMTNLHNYRYFKDRLHEELNRAKRHGKNVSLMIMDIDHFKNYNDALGHQAGDEVLRNIGKVLRNIIRDEDIVARYGGEEFCIILPGIQKDGLSALGERVRAKIESEPFYKEEVQPGGKVTISLGIATFPDDASDFDELINKADRALYQAKNLGRNQIKVFEEI